MDDGITASIVLMGIAAVCIVWAAWLSHRNLPDYSFNGFFDQLAELRLQQAEREFMAEQLRTSTESDPDQPPRPHNSRGFDL
jgi:hypothetical protein